MLLRLYIGISLRFLILNVYSFGSLGSISLYAGIGAFIGAAIFLVLGLLGLRHSKTAADLPVVTQRAPAIA
jgi:hypothetical protein